MSDQARPNTGYRRRRGSEPRCRGDRFQPPPVARAPALCDNQNDDDDNNNVVVVDVDNTNTNDNDYNYNHYNNMTRGRTSNNPQRSLSYDAFDSLGRLGEATQEGGPRATPTLSKRLVQSQANHGGTRRKKNQLNSFAPTYQTTWRTPAGHHPEQQQQQQRKQKQPPPLSYQNEKPGPSSSGSTAPRHGGRGRRRRSGVQAHQQQQQQPLASARHLQERISGVVGRGASISHYFAHDFPLPGQADAQRRDYHSALKYAAHGNQERNGGGGDSTAARMLGMQDKIPKKNHNRTQQHSALFAQPPALKSRYTVANSLETQSQPAAAAAARRTSNHREMVDVHDVDDDEEEDDGDTDYHRTEWAQPSHDRSKTRATETEPEPHDLHVSSSLSISLSLSQSSFAETTSSHPASLNAVCSVAEAAAAASQASRKRTRSEFSQPNDSSVAQTTATTTPKNHVNLEEEEEEEEDEEDHVEYVGLQPSRSASSQCVEETLTTRTNAKARSQPLAASLESPDTDMRDDARMDDSTLSSRAPSVVPPPVHESTPRDPSRSKLLDVAGSFIKGASTSFGSFWRLTKRNGKCKSLGSSSTGGMCCVWFPCAFLWVGYRLCPMGVSSLLLFASFFCQLTFSTLITLYTERTSKRQRRFGHCETPIVPGASICQNRSLDDESHDPSTFTVEWRIGLIVTFAIATAFFNSFFILSLCTAKVALEEEDYKDWNNEVYIGKNDGDIDAIRNDDQRWMETLYPEDSNPKQASIERKRGVFGRRPSQPSAESQSKTLFVLNDGHQRYEIHDDDRLNCFAYSTGVQTSRTQPKTPEGSLYKTETLDDSSGKTTIKNANERKAGRQKNSSQEPRRLSTRSASKKVNAVIEIDSDNEEVENESSSKEVSCAMSLDQLWIIYFQLNQHALSNLKLRNQYDAARIAIGTKVFSSDCHVKLSRSVGEALELSWKVQSTTMKTRSNNNAYSKHESIEIITDDILELKYFNPDGSEQDEVSNSINQDDDEDENQMCFLSLKVVPADRNRLTNHTSYNHKGSAQQRYLVIEFRSDHDFRNLLGRLKGSAKWKVFTQDVKNLTSNQARKYAKTLLEDSQKDKRLRCSSAGSPLRKKKVGFLAGKGSDDVLLVYPFNGEKDVLEQAAQGLTEASGRLTMEYEMPKLVALTDNPSPQPLLDGEGESENKRPRAHYVTIRVNDFERLEPGEFLNDSLIDFWCSWYVFIILIF